MTQHESTGPFGLRLLLGPSQLRRWRLLTAALSVAAALAVVWALVHSPPRWPRFTATLRPCASSGTGAPDAWCNQAGTPVAGSDGCQGLFQCVVVREGDGPFELRSFDRYTDMYSLRSGSWRRVSSSIRGWDPTATVRPPPLTVLRVPPPHPIVWAGLFGLGALLVWRVARRVTVTVEPHGVRVGGRWVPRHTLRAARVETFGPLTWLALDTDEGTLRTPPGGMGRWALRLLLDQITELVPSESERSDQSRAQEQARRRLEEAGVT